MADPGEPRKEELFYLPTQEVKLEDFTWGDGWILDIGGGGEGIIGKLKGNEVVAIDVRENELKGTTNDALKIVMDARDLKFLDESFGAATSFFTFTYLSWEDCESVFAQVHRVLKPGGEFLIWDASLREATDMGKEMVAVMLRVVFPDGEVVETGYGGQMRDQDMGDFLRIAERHGFQDVEKRRTGGTFFLRLRRAS
jgi:ubiquinone/menaquinone biosynthesis C-methylase UbiE